MKVSYINQRFDDEVNYTFNGDTVTIIYGKSSLNVVTDKDGKMRIEKNIENLNDVFDFANFPEGAVIEKIDTTLPLNPIRKVKRTDGILYLTLLNFYDSEYSKKSEEWQVI